MLKWKHVDLIASEYRLCEAQLEMIVVYTSIGIKCFFSRQVKTLCCWSAQMECSTWRTTVVLFGWWVHQRSDRCVRFVWRQGAMDKNCAILPRNTSRNSHQSKHQWIARFCFPLGGRKQLGARAERRGYAFSGLHKPAVARKNLDEFVIVFQTAWHGTGSSGRSDRQERFRR